MRLKGKKYMNKKRAWEVEYEKYLSGAMDKVYSDLSEKYKNKAIKKADYDQLKRIEKIRPNINKVTNILELRSKLQNKLKNLEDEKKSISGVEASLKKIANAEK